MIKLIIEEDPGNDYCNRIVLKFEDGEIEKCLDISKIVVNNGYVANIRFGEVE